MKDKKLPVVVTRGIFILPTTSKTIEFGRTKSKNALNASVESYNNQVVVVSQESPLEEEPNLDHLFYLGTVANLSIKKVWKDGTISAELEYDQKIKIDEFVEENGVIYALGSVFEDKIPRTDIQKNKIKEILIELQEKHSFNTSELLLAFNDNDLYKLNSLIYQIIDKMPLVSLNTKLLLIQSTSILEKLDLLKELIVNRPKPTIKLNNNSSVDSEINKKLKDKMDKQQKEYYLREKMRIIKEELEDESSDASQLDKYKKRLEEEPFPEPVKEKILSSIKRIETMQPGSAEVNVERNYVDWMMSIPWWEQSEDIDDLKYAQEILEKHHFGLKKVKERIIEYLAVKQKTKSLKGPIITFVGPPGVGKTSLARSIAEALGKKFVKVSLGGVKDESEIRGHRKTYVGSMPGRIIQALKRAKVKNPLFLLDEIDKMASDNRGDPASAMLEVLDPEQNKEFSDHYIEEPYDLSTVMFIATANYIENIPEALYDRMEIINLSSYTEIEKMHIAKDYLTKKILEEDQLTEDELKFTDEAYDEIIKYYTREAGARQLERHLTTIARKFIVKLLNGEISNLVVTREVVVEYLGKHIFEHTSKEEESQVGVVTGLAYTQFGGDILPIEVSTYAGKGNLTLTGKLGEVMKESASIALTYVKANHEKFGITKEKFDDIDIHIHVPEGAVPKDGPSAGITLTTALISALSKQPVSKDFGMTGEITLRGNVLPIGGLREKSISAARSGLKHILIPSKNVKDIEDIPQEVQDVLKITPVSKYEDVYEIIFNNKNY
ncbi:endopeptidase La [Mycoplasma capricolum subsp. capripneumoniae]|uniref:endopeptidase La n=1 Tax=Mycoplasma capricolum TaxID=2095 RepID=UPI0004D78124|nr:endopeptidase La [Mycoplasma capricolum]KEY84622.1 ATP-dependent protease La [Mycoplasma capricolum subsp. capripneumoniae 99108]QDL19678.1 endopeptidase La [Mycoplasma capricolum subsp. capripneumoniae]QDL20363.1 endopeptidase La [Mycoplasma capricolum subsp. capripneumoniae]QDL21050.1 endopeptidase La [Mycoplasma capricolum subsp. capripneumoniae]QIF40318.1 endopeptidase La [Mycoplasma capricolum subsp. capripneumoniae]